MNDFRSESEELKKQMVFAISRVIDSGHYVLGREVAEFEKSWATECGVTHGVGVGNGLDAIEIILRCLNIGPGDEVITTPMTAFASVLAIQKVGAIPVLADIDADTALMSLESANRCVTKKTKAILLVHLYGQIRKLDKWVDYCNDHGINLIEDCAQSHFASSKGRVAGSFGIAGAYSFYPTKNLGALGDAGMIVTNDTSLAERASRIRNYGQNIRYSHSEFGLNSRLDEIQEAILSVRLSWLRRYDDRRKQIADSYRQSIKNKKIRLLCPPEERAAHANHLFVLTTDQRDQLQQFLAELGVQTLIHYPVPIHLQEPCKDIKRDSAGLSVSELHARTCLSLPCHPQLEDQALAVIVDGVNLF